jgi:hypothetical protein
MAWYNGGTVVGLERGKMSNIFCECAWSLNERLQRIGETPVQFYTGGGTSAWPTTVSMAGYEIADMWEGESGPDGNVKRLQEGIETLITYNPVTPYDMFVQPTPPYDPWSSFADVLTAAGYGAWETKGLIEASEPWEQFHDVFAQLTTYKLRKYLSGLVWRKYAAGITAQQAWTNARSAAPIQVSATQAEWYIYGQPGFWTVYFFGPRPLSGHGSLPYSDSFVTGSFEWDITKSKLDMDVQFSDGCTTWIVSPTDPDSYTHTSVLTSWPTSIQLEILTTIPSNVNTPWDPNPSGIYTAELEARPVGHPYTYFDAYLAGNFTYG